jgi:hypothetical protein
MSKLLSRKEILEAVDRVTEEVEVPEWGGHVIVTSLNGKERDAFEASVLIQKGKDTRVNMKNARAKLVSMATVDEKGERIFSQADIEALGLKNAGALDRVYSVAARLSGLTDDDLKELTEDLEENPFADSSSQN